LHTGSHLRTCSGHRGSRDASSNAGVVFCDDHKGQNFDQFRSVSDDFLEKGLVVSVKGRRDNERREARIGDITNGKKIIVLVNGGTASAAEIVTGDGAGELVQAVLIERAHEQPNLAGVKLRPLPFIGVPEIVEGCSDDEPKEHRTQ
jgi:hypothetical protein